MGTFASPTAAAQWARPALPAPAAHSDHGGGGWRTQAPGGVGAGETIQHTVGRGGETTLPASRGGAKYLKAESRRGKSSASPGGRNHLL